MKDPSREATKLTSVPIECGPEVKAQRLDRAKGEHATVAKETGVVMLILEGHKVTSRTRDRFLKETIEKKE